MKIYIVYKNDVFDNYEIDEVFAYKYLATKYVINKIFSKNTAYANKSNKELEILANEYIEKREVIFNT